MTNEVLREFEGYLYYGVIKYCNSYDCSIAKVITAVMTTQFIYNYTH